MEWTYDKEKIAESYFTIGESLQYGTPSEPFQALACYQKAAELGHMKASVVLSEYYRSKGEFSKELEWLKKVEQYKEEMPSHIAYRLGQYYQYGWESSKTDWAKAHDLYHHASERGSKGAKNVLRFWPVHKLSCICRAAFETD